MKQYLQIYQEKQAVFSWAIWRRPRLHCNLFVFCAKQNLGLYYNQGKAGLLCQPFIAKILELHSRGLEKKQRLLRKHCSWWPQKMNPQ